MLNVTVERAKDDLAGLVKQVAEQGEIIVLQTQDGIQAALVNIDTLPWAALAATSTAEQEVSALAMADTARQRILTRRGGRPLKDSARELQALRELRLLELQGVS